MTLIVEGKEAVLEFLEKEAERIAGKPGIYRLVKDDAGNLIAFLAGRSFLGSGAYSLDGNRMLVQDGIVVKADSIAKD
jgi:hypothetical protein